MAEPVTPKPEDAANFAALKALIDAGDIGGFQEKIEELNNSREDVFSALSILSDDGKHSRHGILDRVIVKFAFEIKDNDHTVEIFKRIAELIGTEKFAELASENNLGVNADKWDKTWSPAVRACSEVPLMQAMHEILGTDKFVELISKDPPGNNGVSMIAIGQNVDALTTKLKSLIGEENYEKVKAVANSEQNNDLNNHEKNLPAGTLISYSKAEPGDHPIEYAIIVGWLDDPDEAGKRKAAVIYPDNDEVKTWSERVLTQRSATKVEADDVDRAIVKSLYGKFIAYYDTKPEYAGQLAAEKRTEIVETYKKLNTNLSEDDEVIATGARTEKDSDHEHNNFLSNIANQILVQRLNEEKEAPPPETIYHIQFKADPNDEDAAKETIRQKLNHIGIPDAWIDNLFKEQNNLAAFKNTNGTYDFYFSHPAHIVPTEGLEQLGIPNFEMDPAKLQAEGISSSDDYNKLYRGWLHKWGGAYSGYPEPLEIQRVRIDGSDVRFNLNEYIIGVDGTHNATTKRAHIVTTLASGEGDDRRESKLSFSQNEVKSNTAHPEAMAGMASLLAAAKWDSVHLEAKSEASLIKAATACIANGLMLSDETQKAVFEAYNKLEGEKPNGGQPAKNYNEVQAILKAVKTAAAPKPPIGLVP